MKNIMAKMADGNHVIGTFCSITSTDVVEILGLSGFDYCIIDGEHGPSTYLTLQDQVMAGDVKDVDISVIFRVPENTSAAIGHALDAGAAGIVVPHVDDVESAKKAVQAAKFYPVGERGLNGIVRAARYGNSNMKEYLKKSNEETMLMIQIEGTEGFNNLDKILEVDGIDGVFIGPYDLSQSMGMPGKVNSPEVQGKMVEIVEKIKSKGKGIYIGIFLTDINQAKKWVDLGVQFITFQTDEMIFANASRAIVNEWNEKMAAK